MNLKNFKIDFKNKKRLIPQVLTISFIIFVIAYFSYKKKLTIDENTPFNSPIINKIISNYNEFDEVIIKN